MYDVKKVHSPWSSYLIVGLEDDRDLINFLHSIKMRHLTFALLSDKLHNGRWYFNNHAFIKIYRNLNIFSIKTSFDYITVNFELYRFWNTLLKTGKTVQKKKKINQFWAVLDRDSID